MGNKRGLDNGFKRENKLYGMSKITIVLVLVVIIVIITIIFNKNNKITIKEIEFSNNISNNTNYILTEDGYVYASGSNNNGQIGDGTKVNISKFKKVEGISNIKKLKVSFLGDVYALTNNGVVYTWGGKSTIDKTQDYISKPIQIKELSNVVDIILGTLSTYALIDDGSVYAWGSNNDGQLGNGNISTKEMELPSKTQDILNIKENYINSDVYRNIVPTKIEGLVNVKEVYVNSKTVHVITEDGKVWAWGDNYNGQIGVNSKEDILKPVEIPNISDVKKIVQGDHTTYAIINDGTVYSWGRDIFGGLGRKYNENIKTPVQITDLNDVKDLVVGKNEVQYAILNNGEVYGWGNSKYGFLLGEKKEITEQYQYTPIKIDEFCNAKKIINNNYDLFVLLEDGTIYVCGNNNDGELGVGDFKEIERPILMNGFTNVEELYSNVNTTYVILDDGKIWAWGDNHNGQIGDGTNSRILEPKLISGFLKK